MNIVTLIPLIDGPLSSDPKAQRADLVARMARILIREGSYVDERSAMRSLRPHFELGDICIVIDHVRQVAMQYSVAMDMGEK